MAMVDEQADCKTHQVSIPTQQRIFFPQTHTEHGFHVTDQANREHGLFKGI